jgi:hypothetical protein
METVMQLKVKLPCLLQAPTILLFETVNIENKKENPFYCSALQDG